MPMQISAFPEGWNGSGERRMWFWAISYMEGMENSWQWMILAYLARYIISSV